LSGGELRLFALARGTTYHVSIKPQGDDQTDAPGASSVNGSSRVTGPGTEGRGRHPDNVVRTTNSGGQTSWPQTIECERVIWLGGRDLNPDNVVQRRKGRRRR
jgi:hypothetical protein